MKPRIIIIIPELSGPTSSVVTELEKLDFQGVIELRTLYGIGSQLQSDFFEGCDAIITRPGCPKLLPEHLVAASRPLVVATLSVGTGHLKEISEMQDVTVVAPSGTNAKGTASVALLLTDLVLRPLHIGCEQMAEGVFDRTVFDEAKRPEGMHWLAVGAGNVVRAMVWGVLCRRPKEITVFNRTFDNDADLQARLQTLIEDVPDGCKTGQVNRIDSGYATTLIGEGNREVPFRLVHGGLAGDETHIPFLSDADIVSLHVPRTPQTEVLFGASLISQIKQGSCLINAGRGDLVDEAEVVRAVEAGHLLGYGSDVVYDIAETERLHTLSPTWARYVSDHSLPVEQRLRLVLTPHTGGHVQPDLRDTAAAAVGDVLSRFGINTDLGL